ncbi:MAG: hypothetical protein E6J56_05460 [Deltaproteobacteria bacterium]|nr:MAG: hypothetical protein E6J56_05460 [Deltaproteobacteria bacterium]
MIVEVDGEARARIQLVGPILPLAGEEEGVHVDRRGEVVGLLSGVLGVQERALAESEELGAAATPAGDDLAELAESVFRVVLEPPEEAPGVHRVACPLARPVRRERVCPE